MKIQYFEFWWQGKGYAWISVALIKWCSHLIHFFAIADTCTQLTYGWIQTARNFNMFKPHSWMKIAMLLSTKRKYYIDIFLPLPPKPVAVAEDRHCISILPLQILYICLALLIRKSIYDRLAMILEVGDSIVVHLLPTDLLSYNRT